MPEWVFNADKSALFGKMPQRTCISEEMSVRISGNNRLTLPFCAKAVGFMIRTAPLYKAANPRVLKKKDKHQLPGFWLCKEAWTMRTLFLDCLF